MDKIYLQGMEFYGYHGFNPEENKLGQRFLVDLVLFASLAEAGRTDDLTKTVNYAEAYERVQSILTGQPLKLIETVAERIAADLLAAFPQVEKVQVKVTKPMPPIAGVLQGAAVEIERSRHA